LPRSIGNAAGTLLIVPRSGPARGIPAARGGKWTAVQVSRLLEVAAIPFFDASAAVAA
jgi:hypothetical protein